MSQKQAWLINAIKQQRALVRDLFDLATTSGRHEYQEFATHEQHNLTKLIRKLGK